MNVVYEHPVTEHMRLLIKLEALFIEIEQSLQFKKNDFALNGLFRLIDLSDLVSGQDLRFDLLKNLDKKNISLKHLKHNPDVNLDLLKETLENIERLKKKIHILKKVPDDNFENDELIQAVKRKYSVKGSLYPFELPLLNFWINQNENFHLNKIRDWLEGFMPIYEAVRLILKITRESVPVLPLTADKGIYEQGSDNDSVIDLIRVLLEPNANVFPEISGNKHKFSIRFLKQESSWDKPVQTIDSIRFELALVSL